MQGIGFWLTQREKVSGDREALVQGERRLTYRELNRRVNRMAAWLSQAHQASSGWVMPVRA